MSLITPRNRQFIDSNGDPIVNGFVYFGTFGTDPKTNLITIYSDEAETLTLSNPQRTDSDGFIENEVFFSVDYAYLVEDENNVTIEGPKDRRLTSRTNFETSDSVNVLITTETQANEYNIDEGFDELPPVGIYSLQFPTANTAAVVATFTGIAGTYPVEDINSAALSSGDIAANRPYMSYWNGSEFRLLETAEEILSPVMTVITGDTTHNYTAGMTKARVRGLGGGAGGGGGAAAALSSGGSGGAGGYCEDFISIVGIATATITVGAAGTGGATDTAGAAGGNSTYSDGTNSFTANGGAAGDAAGGTSYSAGGTATGASINISGAHGGAVDVNDNSDSTECNGRNTPLGVGGLFAQVDSTVKDATGYGASGAAGKGNGAASADESGGEGAPGVWIIEEMP